VSARLLVLDIGGTNLRATVLDERGSRVATAVADSPHQCDVPPVGRRYDPEALWGAVCSASRAALGAGGDDVAAVAATGQRLACAFLDAAGETLYVGPNTDARGVMTGWQVDEAAGGSLYERTGRGMPALFAPARLLWFRENQPELFEQVRRVVGLGEWVAHHLCGEVGIELCGAVELLAVDLHTGAWWEELWSALGLDPAWLPPLLTAGARLGSVTPAAAAATGLRAGVPVALSPPDSMAALLGAGSAAPGWTMILAGSTMPVIGSAAQPAIDPTGRTWSGRHPISGRGVHESNAGTTGFGWAWVVERLVGGIAGLRGEAAYQRAEQLAASAPPGARDALHFAGGAGVMDVRNPVYVASRWNSALWPPAYLRDDVDAADLIRAALEGVAFTARANVEQVEEARGGDPGPVVLAGGMARSRLFRQMVADVLGRPVRVPAQVEATDVGAAACAALAVGLHVDLEEAAAAMTRTEVVAEPDALVSAPQMRAFHEWRNLYAKVKAL